MCIYTFLSLKCWRALSFVVLLNRWYFKLWFSKILKHRNYTKCSSYKIIPRFLKNMKIDRGICNKFRVLNYLPLLCTGTGSTTTASTFWTLSVSSLNLSSLICFRLIIKSSNDSLSKLAIFKSAHFCWNGDPPSLVVAFIR